MKLQGKTVVVTGAAGGIGLATARACLGAGARVHLTDVDPRVVAVAAELGPVARGHAHDVRDPAAWEALRAATGAVDVLVNNAGVCIGGPSDELPLEAWRQSVDVNLWGPIHGIRACLPDMLARGQGVIVNVASVAGLMAFPMMGPYCTSKFALLGLSEALAVELAGRGIQVCTVCPGAVRTQLLAKSQIALPGKAREVIDKLIERLATPPERMAADIVAAIQDGRPLLVAAGTMWPLYALHRAAPGLYGWLFRATTKLATRAGR
jgi:NAD(P)-dependent dehydrogenase (short-subunit alcohol dehydrogenase family)